jgi:hypothetical protein
MRDHTIDESIPTDDAEPVEVTPLGGSYVTTTSSIRAFGRYTDTDFARPHRQDDPSRRRRRRG